MIRKHERPSYKLKYKKAIPLEEMELVPDAHEAIISKEEFDRVQQIRKGRRVSYFDKNNEPHKYVGLLFCGKCKTAMRKRYLASHKDYDGYMCGFHQKQGQNYCELNNITFEKLDELVVFAINQQLKQMKMDMKNLETKIRQKQPEAPHLLPACIRYAEEKPEATCWRCLTVLWWWTRRICASRRVLHGVRFYSASPILWS